MILSPIESLPAVDFLSALAAASATLTPPYTTHAMADLNGLPKGGSGRFFIRALGYSAVERVGLGFDFFADSAGTIHLGRFTFPSAEGYQMGGAGTYLFYIDGLAIPYYDADRLGSQNPPRLHVRLSNVDTVAKSAAGAGAVTVRTWVESMQDGWTA